MGKEEKILRCILVLAAVSLVLLLRALSYCCMLGLSVAYLFLLLRACSCRGMLGLAATCLILLNILSWRQAWSDSSRLDSPLQGTSRLFKASCRCMKVGEVHFSFMVENNACLHLLLPMNNKWTKGRQAYNCMLGPDASSGKEKQNLHCMLEPAASWAQ